MKPVRKKLPKMESVKCPLPGCPFGLVRPVGASSLCADGHEIPATAAEEAAGKTTARPSPCGGHC